MNGQNSHRCSSSDGSLFYIVLNYSSTAAWAAANKPWLSVFYKFSVRDFSIFGTQTARFYMHIWTVLH